MEWDRHMSTVTVSLRSGQAVVPNAAVPELWDLLTQLASTLSSLFPDLEPVVEVNTGTRLSYEHF